MNRVIQFWSTLRSSFWFVPTLCVAGSIGFALVMIEADATVGEQWLTRWPQIFGVGAEGARLLLSTLASSMMTVMGITFSMTLLALVQASSQYTSRILASFMRSRVTQATLGIFSGIFVYCLVVLRTIRGDGNADEFVPGLAVLFGFIMSIGGVGALVYFIHHIASSIQASSIIAAVAEETDASIEHSMPSKLDQIHDQKTALHQKPSALEPSVWHTIPAAKSGYIQNVNMAALIAIAHKKNTALRMEHGIGGFVVQNTALISIASTFPPEHETIVAINAVYSLGRHRSIEQDMTFGIRQIVDIALKALSPGINDTSTAVTCVDYLSSILAKLAGRKFPLTHHYEGDTLRLWAIVPSFEGLLAEAFNQIRENGEANSAMIARLLVALEVIASVTMERRHVAALDEQLQSIADLVDRKVKPIRDRAWLEDRIAQVGRILGTRAALCPSKRKCSAAS